MNAQEYNKIVSTTLRVVRELRRMTQGEVAQLLNMSQSNYSKIESGQNTISKLPSAVYILEMKRENGEVNRYKLVK